MQKYSVAMCTCNGEQFVKEQLESILSQTILPEEIVISDDRSTDNTLGVVESISRSSPVSFKVIRNKERLGVGNNFMQCIHNCTSPIIFTSDQDDVWLPQKAERILNVFQNHSKALLVFSDGELVDGFAQPLGETIWHGLRISHKMVDKGDWFSYLLRGGYVAGSAMAIKKELASGINSIPRNWLHDEWLAFAAAIQKGIIAYPESLFLYRQHSGNVMGMKRLGFWGHVKRWKESLGKIQNTRGIKLLFYGDIKDAFANMLSLEQERQLSKCIRFLVDGQELMNQKKSKRITTVTRNIFNHGYQRFSSGFFSVLRDLTCSFLK